MNQNQVVEVRVNGGMGRVWESRPGQWSWAHPDGSEGCGESTCAAAIVMVESVGAIAAEEWVYGQDEDDDHHDDPNWDANLRRAFFALYGREPDAYDEQAGLWSLCCAATPNCGTRPDGKGEA